MTHIKGKHPGTSPANTPVTRLKRNRMVVMGLGCEESYLGFVDLRPGDVHGAVQSTGPMVHLSHCHIWIEVMVGMA